MKAETADCLAKAHATLADAQQIATLPLPHVAAREAYLAAFHAAEAYIFEHTGKVAKTHRGARSSRNWPESTTSGWRRFPGWLCRPSMEKSDARL